PPLRDLLSFPTRRSSDLIPDRVKGPAPPLRLDVQMGAHRARADVVAERQAALPALRDGRPGDRLEEAAGVAVAHRDDRNARDVERILWQPPGARDRRPARCGGIAVAVHHAAALNAVGVAHRPLGIDVAPEEAVVLRIGVDDQPDRAPLLRLARLDTAERAPVARNHDLAVHADAQRIECLVVLDQPVVHVDDFGRDIAVAGVSVEGRDLRADARLAEIETYGLAARTDDQGSFDGIGLRQINAVLLTPGIDAPRAQLAQHVIACRGLRGCAGHVGGR